MPPRRGVIESFFARPEIQAGVSRLVTDWVVPNAFAFTRDAYRAFQFPTCLAVPVNPQTFGCRSPGVGACQYCHRPFCSDHGLIYLSGAIDPQLLAMQFHRPLPGLCTKCVEDVFAAAASVRQGPSGGNPQAQVSGVGVGPPPPPSPSSAAPGAPAPKARKKPAATGPSPASHLPPRVRGAFAVLGLDPAARCTLEDVKKAQRTQAVQYHPDKGVDQKEMYAVNEAADILERHLQGRKAA